MSFASSAWAAISGVVHVVRVRGGVADAREPLDRREAADERGEGDAVAVAVGVDVLPEEGDLDDAARDELAGLGLDPRGRARDLGAAGVGHDAEGAELVAALLHGQEGRRRPPGAAVLRQVVELVLGGEVGLDRPLAGLAPRDEVGQPVIGLRADDEVDRGRRARISAPSAWATQPVTPMRRSGAVRP